MRRLNSRFAGGTIKTLQASVPETLDHLYSVSTRYTNVKDSLRRVPHVPRIWGHGRARTPIPSPLDCVFFSLPCSLAPLLPVFVNFSPTFNSLQPSPFQRNKKPPDRADYFPRIATLDSCRKNNTAHAHAAWAHRYQCVPHRGPQRCILGQSAQKPQNMARKSLSLGTFRNNPFAFNGLEEMIKPYPAKNKAVSSKTPWGGRPR